jgi:glutathione synthase/RimK-type ligase-like ATP-grasp enzyme
MPELLEGLALVHAGRENNTHLIAQQYIGPAHEYRAVFFKGNLQFACEKNRHGTEPGHKVVFGQNASPSMWPDAEMQEIEDQYLLERFKDAGRHVYQEFGAAYVGLDIRIDENDELWILECNSAPMGLERVNQHFKSGPQVLEHLGALMVDELVCLSGAIRRDVDYHLSGLAAQVA